jgi:hypothetical protein
VAVRPSLAVALLLASTHPRRGIRAGRSIDARSPFLENVLGGLPHHHLFPAPTKRASYRVPSRRVWGYVEGCVKAHAGEFRNGVAHSVAR